MRISSITKNAGKACNNRLYRHIRTFEKIIKNYFVIYNTQLSQICSFAILAAASVYFTGMVVDHKDQTTGQAFMSGMVSAGTVLGSLFGGAIIDHMGMRAMLSVNIFITIAGLFIAVCSVRLIRGRKKCEGV